MSTTASPDFWTGLRNDERLARARQRLSMDELRMIYQHAVGSLTATEPPLTDIQRSVLDGKFGVWSASDGDIKKLWRECGGTQDEYTGRDPRAKETYRIADTGFLQFIVALESRCREAERDIEGRLAFKAGWRTNATTEHSAEYLDGCERVDWEEYKARGLTGYLDAIKPDAALEQYELRVALDAAPLPASPTGGDK